ncbi:MAG: hypothetical protein WC538_22135 [Thermoanaerobaculia bacterium]|jgi:hypothetical protein
MGRNRHITIPLDCSLGMWATGDPGRAPKGYARLLRNVLYRDDHWALRPEFTYDGIASVVGAGIWEDETNNVARAFCIDSSGKLRVKGVSGNTWGAPATGTITGTRLSGYTNFAGRLYGVMDDGSGGPVSAFVFNGSEVKMNPFLGYTGSDPWDNDGVMYPPYSVYPFEDSGNSYSGAYIPDSGVSAVALASWKSRAFLIGPRVSFRNRLGNSAGARWSHAYPSSAYSFTNSMDWYVTGGVLDVLQSPDGSTTHRVITQSLSACAIMAGSNISNITPPSNTEFPTTFSFEIQMPRSVTFDLPVRVRAAILGMVTSYAPRHVEVGQKIWNGPGDGTYGSYWADPSTSFLYECVVAGDRDATDFPYTVDGSGLVTDGTATFRKMGSTTFIDEQYDVASDGEWHRINVPMNVPGLGGLWGDVQIRLDFSNDTTPTLPENVEINIAFKDGRADGDPDKRNHGWQWTYGSYAYPFGNLESTTNAEEAVADLPEIAFSEVLEPRKIASTNSFDLTGSASKPTAAAITQSGTLVVFRRRTANLFTITEDPDLPLMPVGEERAGLGAIGPMAVAEHMGVLFFITEDGITAWNPEVKRPVELLGKGMRSIVMDRGANWVENQSTPANRPLLAVDRENSDLWVYTQKGVFFVHHIPHGPGAGWSRVDVGGGDSTDPHGYECAGMYFNPNTRNMEFVFSTAATGVAGIARLDPTVAGAAGDSISDSGTLSVITEYTPGSIEVANPLADIQIDAIRLWHQIEAEQDTQAWKVLLSRDGGVTYAEEIPFTFDVSGGDWRALTVWLYLGWEGILLKVQRVGNGGESNLRISRVEADVTLLRGAFPRHIARGV